VDTLPAATAMTHELTLVTRNTADVEDVDVRVLNPFANSNLSG
jgi:predicted nucleic acid-binding protein